MSVKQALLGIGLLLLSACRGAQSALDPAGPQASRIDSLTDLFTVVSTVIYVLVLTFLLYAMLRAWFNMNSTPGEIPAQKRATVTIGVCVALTVVILAVFLVESVAKGRALSTYPPRQKTLEVDVIGHQWWWEFEYANPSASMRVTTADEIHIPVGRPVMIRTDTRDVIHSFWVPNLHGKIDLIPNHVNTTYLQADRPGTYRGECAEYCGLQHAHMSFLVIAEPEAEFERWIAAQRAPARTPSTPRRQRGQQVFLAAPCVICHRIRGTEAMGQAGPDLTHFGSRRTIAAGTLPNTPGNLAGWITDSQHIKPGNRMPPINLLPQDMEPLLDYLESLI